MAFMRIRSPSNAPPVFCFVGSTERIATRLSGNSFKKRRISSSVKEDLPAPPVPVIPRIGVPFERFRASSNIFLVSSSAFDSAAVIKFAKISGVSGVTNANFSK